MLLIALNQVHFSSKKMRAMQKQMQETVIDQIFTRSVDVVMKIIR